MFPNCRASANSESPRPLSTRNDRLRFFILTHSDLNCLTGPAFVRRQIASVPPPARVSGWWVRKQQRLQQPRIDLRPANRNQGNQHPPHRPRFLRGHRSRWPSASPNRFVFHQWLILTIACSILSLHSYRQFRRPKSKENRSGLNVKRRRRGGQDGRPNRKNGVCPAWIAVPIPAWILPNAHRPGVERLKIPEELLNNCKAPRNAFTPPNRPWRNRWPTPTTIMDSM